MKANKMETNTTNDHEYAGEATYCPEDNKLRLYVGRVPRDEYLKLKADGWVALHKQREAGGGDFAAPWTPERRNTALDYAGFIGDEDQGPAERAADRAERFGGYRDKRSDEATGQADRYDSGPSAHGFQSAARAERAVVRHDRIAHRACDSWSKAEYWQRRTAGVIGHALHVAKPGVRMGRIKTIEAELRGLRARWEHSGETISERAQDWITHLELRLAYENQMLAAQGGRLEQCEVLPGGKLGGRLIIKVSKSPVTGRATSCDILGPKVSGYHYQVSNITGTDFAAHKFDLERLSPDAYKPPTDESLKELADFKKLVKESMPEKAPCPLVNPIDADAERLQALWNERAKAAYFQRNKWDKPENFKPSTICRITQATYSENSIGNYARAQALGLCADAELQDRYSDLWSSSRQDRKDRIGNPFCKVRTTHGDGSGSYSADRVIILTDKPQKALPAAVWEKRIVKEQPELVEA